MSHIMALMHLLMPNKPGYLTKYECSTSLKILWLNEHESSPMFKNLMESLLSGMEVIIRVSHGELNLECDADDDLYSNEKAFHLILEHYYRDLPIQLQAIY